MWRECKLGDVGIVITGKTPSKNNPEDWGDEIPFVTPSDYKLYRKKASLSERRLSSFGIDKLKNKILPKNSILVTCIGSDMGKVVMNDVEVITNQQINAIVPDKGINNDFIYYLLVSLYDMLWIFGGDGTALPIINKSDFENLNILLPPLPEQKAIASVLSSLDDKIDLLHRQNQTLESMAETLFRQWFVEEADEGWEEGLVGDYVKTNQNNLTKSFELSLIQYLDTSSLCEGQISDLQILPINEAPSRAKRIVNHNDVLISTVRPNQKHYGIVYNPPENLIVSTGFCVITCEKISPHFIYIFLTTDEMTEYLHSIAEGSTSTYPSLKPSDIENLKFQIPPKDKLEKFSKFAESTWEKVNLNYKQIKTLEALRDTLLPKLMSGEVRVKYD